MKKNDNKKDIKYVEVFRAEAVQERLGLSQAGILMFVLLVGGNYDQQGLQGCGQVAALEACRHYSGQLAEMLWNTAVRQCDLKRWTSSLAEYFLTQSTRKLAVPAGFPRELVFKNYRHPKVSNEVELNNLNGLRRGWDLAIDEAKLQTFFRERFNIWTKGYLKHVLPALLVRTLRDVPEGRENRSSQYGIKILPRRGKASMETYMESKITFEHQHVSRLNLMVEPAEFEDWSLLKGDKGTSFDPSLPVGTEILDYILWKGLGQDTVDCLKAEAAKPQIRKRKNISDESQALDDDDTETPPAKKKLRKGKAKAETISALNSNTSPAKARKEKKKDVATQSVPKTVPVRPIFRMLACFDVALIVTKRVCSE